MVGIRGEIHEPLRRISISAAVHASDPHAKEAGVGREQCRSPWGTIRNLVHLVNYQAIREAPLFRYLFPRSFAQWLGPLVAVGALVAALVGIVLGSGIADLSASTPHPTGWAELLHAVFLRSTSHHADPRSVPGDLDSPSMVMKGATYYASTCAHCHGAPQLGQNPIALSMRPQPQYLPTAVKRFSPAELFYVVKHGVKYSAMPAWAAQTRDDEVWPVVSFLRALPSMRYAQFEKLAYGTPATNSGAVVPKFSPPDAPTPYQLHAADSQTDPANLYAAPAFGFADIQTGDVAASCTKCHGEDGRGRVGGRFPNLTLQTGIYLRDALSAFASGKRRSAYMQNVATQLTAAQMDALAARYAVMASAPLAMGTPDPALKQEGARIAGYGAVRHAIGECTACHGITRAVGNAVPRLEGQTFGYLVDQMRAFRAGGRGHAGGKDVMSAIAGPMTDHQILAVATYYASTPPSAKPIATSRAVAAR